MSSSAMPQAAGGDPFGPLLPADPYSHYNRVRAESPIYWSSFLQGWVLTRYADVKAALLDPRLSSALTREVQTAQLSEDLRQMLAPINEVLGIWMIFQDHPTHRRLRQLFSAAFTPRIIERMRLRIEAIAHELIDARLAQGKMDLVTDYALPLPAQVLTELLGAPPSDARLLQRWVQTISIYFAIGSFGNAITIPMLHEAVQQMMDYIRVIVDERRRSPREDLISNLIAVEQEGSRLSETELMSQCILLLNAGHESTGDTISSGLFHLLRNPEQRDLLANNPTLAESAVEEALRYEPAFHFVVRVAAEDVEIGGQQIAAGQQIIALLAAANRDPRYFADPDRFDITRRPNPHLTFGHGPHFCLGAGLARLQGAITFSTLLRRLPDLQLVSETPAWREEFGPRSLKTLPVTFTPGPHPLPPLPSPAA